MSSTAELYGMMPTAGSGQGLPASAKYANPWSKLVVNQQSREGVPDQSQLMAHPALNTDPNYRGGNDLDYGDNLETSTALLKKEFPAANTPEKQFSALTDAYDVPGVWQMLRKNKLPATIGDWPIPVVDQNPTGALTKYNTVFMPTDEQMKDRNTELNSGANRSFGVIAHELHHAFDGHDFHPTQDKNGRQQTMDSMGNQVDHFRGGMQDRDMANALQLLDLSHRSPVPDDIRRANPWMGARDHQPTKNDLFQWLGTHSKVEQ